MFAEFLSFFKGFAKRAGEVQAHFLLFFLYYLFILPYGLFLRLLFRADPLDSRFFGKQGSYWRAWKRTSDTLSEAKKQY